jgi:hypothetical protein
METGISIMDSGVTNNIHLVTSNTMPSRVFSAQSLQRRRNGPVPGELLFRPGTGHVTLLRAKRPADAPLCSSFNVADFKGIRAG